MSYCVNCGLPPAPDCASHVQTIHRKKVAAKVERDPKQDQSIHPRVRNGRTVHAKVNTCAPKRGKA
jgi:hypothetical protein